MREYNRLKEEAGKQSARYTQILDSINREQKSDQDRLDNESRKKTDIDNKIKQKEHVLEEATKRIEKLEEHIRTSEAALEEQKKLRGDLQSDVGSSKDRIQELQTELENISEQLGDAKVDKHEVSRTKKKTEIVENFKRLFPGVVSIWHDSINVPNIYYNIVFFPQSMIVCTTCASLFINVTTLPSLKCLENTWKLSLSTPRKLLVNAFSIWKNSTLNQKPFYLWITFKQSH